MNNPLEMFDMKASKIVQKLDPIKASEKKLIQFYYRSQL